MNVPSFMVRVDSQKHIDFALNSPFGGGRPGRCKRRNVKARRPCCPPLRTPLPEAGTWIESFLPAVHLRCFCSLFHCHVFDLAHPRCGAEREQEGGGRRRRCGGRRVGDTPSCRSGERDRGSPFVVVLRCRSSRYHSKKYDYDPAAVFRHSTARALGRVRTSCCMCSFPPPCAICPIADSS